MSSPEAGMSKWGQATFRRGAGMERIYFLICDEVDSQDDDAVKVRIWSDQIRS